MQWNRRLNKKGERRWDTTIHHGLFPHRDNKVSSYIMPLPHPFPLPRWAAPLELCVKTVPSSSYLCKVFCHSKLYRHNADDNIPQLTLNFNTRPNKVPASLGLAIGKLAQKFTWEWSQITEVILKREQSTGGVTRAGFKSSRKALQCGFQWD